MQLETVRETLENGKAEVSLKGERDRRARQWRQDGSWRAEGIVFVSLTLLLCS